MMNKKDLIKICFDYSIDDFEISFLSSVFAELAKVYPAQYRRLMTVLDNFMFQDIVLKLVENEPDIYRRIIQELGIVNKNLEIKNGR